MINTILIAVMIAMFFWKLCDIHKIVSIVIIGIMMMGCSSKSRTFETEHEKIIVEKKGKSYIVQNKTCTASISFNQRTIEKQYGYTISIYEYSGRCESDGIFSLLVDRDLKIAMNTKDEVTISTSCNCSKSNKEAAKGIYEMLLRIGNQ